MRIGTDQCTTHVTTATLHWASTPATLHWASTCKLSLTAMAHPCPSVSKKGILLAFELPGVKGEVHSKRSDRRLEQGYCWRGRDKCCDPLAAWNRVLTFSVMAVIANGGMDAQLSDIIGMAWNWLHKCAQCIKDKEKTDVSCRRALEAPFSLDNRHGERRWLVSLAPRGCLKPLSEDSMVPAKQMPRLCDRIDNSLLCHVSLHHRRTG